MDPDTGWGERVAVMRENPLATVPDPLFTETHLVGPYLGRSVHQVSGPAEIKSVMQDNFEAWRKSPLILRMMTPILGDAIIVAHGESWKRQRMTLQPAFLRRNLDRFVPIMSDAASVAVTTLRDATVPIDVHDVMTDTTFSIIERVLFTEVHGFDRAEVRKAIETLLEEIGQVRYSDLVPFPEWVPRLMSSQGRAARTVFRSAADNQINHRRKTANSGEDLLGLLLDARNEGTGEGLSDTDIRNTLMTVVAAGHETTAIALTWALYLVANDPDCQRALQAEADAVLTGEIATTDHISGLVLTRQVIEEALRLYPPAPVLGRRATSDTEICGKPVKAGDVALLVFYALHRHEKLWDHPDRFDPDRWSPDRRPTDRYMSMAFGGGPRACIGAQFALMEAALVLATILSKLNVEPDQQDVEPVMQVTLRPRGGLKLRFEARRA